MSILKSVVYDRERWSETMFSYEINKMIEPEQIHDLRQAVRWNRMDKVLSNSLLKDYLRIGAMRIIN